MGMDAALWDLIVIQRGSSIHDPRYVFKSFLLHPFRTSFYITYGKVISTVYKKECGVLINLMSHVSCKTQYFNKIICPFVSNPTWNISFQYKSFVLLRCISLKPFGLTGRFSNKISHLYSNLSVLRVEARL